jgi:hypothetical protein
MGFWRDLFKSEKSIRAEEEALEQSLKEIEDSMKEGYEDKPVELYEVVVRGDNFQHVYQDLKTYTYSIKKNGHAVLDLKFVDTYQQVVYAAGNWKMISSTKQDIKPAEVDQVKLAWEDPEKKKLPEFPVTLEN